MKKIDENAYIIGKTLTLFDKKKVVHTEVKTHHTDSSSDDYITWGEDNTAPQQLFKKFLKVDAAVGGLDVLASAHYGTGFKLFKDEMQGQSIQSVEQLLSTFPEVQSFFNRTRWQIFMSEIVYDYELYNVAFPEFLLSPDKSKIISVKRHQAAHCRFGKPNKKTGMPEKIFINKDWEAYDEDFTAIVPCFSATMWIEEIQQICKMRNIDRFIIPITGILTTEKVYPKVGWHSSFRNGWADVVLSVPEFKKYMFENQLNIKYLVYVADDFFAHKFGQDSWVHFSDEKKEELRIELVNKIDQHLSGNKSSGRSLISPYFRDQNNNLIKGIEITPIDDKIKDGNFLPDAASGNSQILFSMGVDPCLLGAGIPGGKNLSGSGSDKREAYTILCSRMPIRRSRTLEIFNKIRDWNGWDSALYGNYPNVNLTTLDKNPNGVTEIVN